MLVITAFQRSGTTAFGEQLGATPKFAYWGEVFHPDGYRAAEIAPRLRLRSAANWFRFVDDQLPTEFKAGPQDPTARIEIWRRYTAKVGELSLGRRPVIDIKYNSWHHLEPVWSVPGARPLLMRAIAENGGVFVHLIRRNVLAQALSEVFAHESGHWHRRHGQAIDFKPFRFSADTEGLLDRMNASRRGAERVRAWLHELPATEIAYETLFEEQGEVSVPTREGLDRVGVEVPLMTQGPVLARTGQNPRDWLVNRKEVYAALAGTEFEELLEPTLGSA